MSKPGYYPDWMCNHDGSIDIAVRSPDKAIVCTTLGRVGDDVMGAIADAFKRAELIAHALNAYRRAA